MTATGATAGRLPVLWLYGPPGVGKSTIAWEVFAATAGERRIAYVDLDQLGMCYGPPTDRSWAPEPASDYGRHRLQAGILDAMLPVFAEAGAAGVVVSGVVDRVLGASAALLPQARLTTLRLRADLDELRRRLDGRRRPEEVVDPALPYARELDRLSGPVLDTTGQTLAASVAAVRERCRHWLDTVDRFTDRTPDPPPNVESPTGPGPGRVLWLCGPTAVGKSTIGWQVYQQSSRRGRHTGFVDLRQIGFVRPAPPGDPQAQRVKAANLAVLWRSFRAAGARQLVVVGHLDSAADLNPYLTALPSSSLTVCRLRASEDQLRARVAERGRGHAPQLVGDELRGRTADVLDEAADRAIQQARALDVADPGDFSIDTDRSPEAVAAEIIDRAGTMAR